MLHFFVHSKVFLVFEIWCNFYHLLKHEAKYGTSIIKDCVDLLLWCFCNIVHIQIHVSDSSLFCRSHVSRFCHKINPTAVHLLKAFWHYKLYTGADEIGSAWYCKNVNSCTCSFSFLVWLQFACWCVSNAETEF